MAQKIVLSKGTHKEFIHSIKKTNYLYTMHFKKTEIVTQLRIKFNITKKQHGQIKINFKKHYELNKANVESIIKRENDKRTYSIVEMNDIFTNTSKFKYFNQCQFVVILSNNKF